VVGVFLSGLMKMGIHNLDKMFKPATVAVIGGCSHSDRVGSVLISNLKNGGFAGKIFQWRRTATNSAGFLLSPPLAQVSGPVDLALIGSPLPSVPAVIREML